MSETKEQIYDNQISPLMEKIIEICKQNKIGMVMSFHLPDSEQDTLHCTTGLVGDEYEPSSLLLDMWSVINPHKSSTQITVEKANGDKELIAILG